MGFRDLHSNIKVVRGVTPQAIGTTGAANGKTSGVIDTSGYRGVEFIIEYGSVTATNATIVPVMKECSTSNGTFTSVADSDMLPSSTQSPGVAPEAYASLGQAAARTSGSTKNTVAKLGYVGSQRYLKIQLWSTVTAGPIVGATAILHHPNFAPVA
jgi:hypothetical protein